MSHKMKLIPIESCILNFEIAPFKRRTEPRTLNLKPRPFNLNLQYMTLGNVQGDPDLESFHSPYFSFAKVHSPTSLQA